VGAGLIVIALILKALFFDMAELAHNGMAPTLLRGERVLIYKKGAPTLGSIAVCQHPTEEGWLVSRVAATEGMTIDSFGKELRIDGEPVVFEEHGRTSFYNADTDFTASLVWGDEHFGPKPHRIFMEEDGRHRIRETELAAGEIYLLNDYRAHWVEDSRAFGPLDASSCRGTIVFRLFPVEGLDREIAHHYFEPIR
jgi:signal peptidase I